MNRIFSCLVVAGLLAIPAVASAEPQYVYVRYGDGKPYVYVTNEPQPYEPPPAYVRNDGLRFDSDVGAMCSTLHTDVHLAPLASGVDAYDRGVLANIADCLTRGAMANMRIEVVAGFDGTLPSVNLADRRLSDVIIYLQALGVRPSQLTYSKEYTPGWQSDRIRFRIATPQPYVVELR